MRTLTIFTPTYNRAYCLHKLYESLCKQTSTDFLWLVVDDGSTDSTQELVNKWIQENKIEIQYIYQENQGMHGGYNTAYTNIKTELNVCVDSDDYITNDAVEKILVFWKQHGTANYAGIVGLDATIDGKIIGKYFPKDLKSSTLENIYYKYNVNGDKKLVYRTEIIKKYPQFPIFQGESFVPLGSLYLQIDKDYELLCLNEIVCIVEYMQDGSTLNIFRQYLKHPKGFRYSRIIEMQYSKYWLVKIKAIIHFVACNIQLKEYNFFKTSKYPVLTYIFAPLGILLHIYIKSKSTYPKNNL